MRRGAALVGGLALAAAGCSTITPIPDSELVYRRVAPEVAFYMLLDSPDTTILDLRPGAGDGTGPAGFGRVLGLPLAELEVRIGELAPLRERTFLVRCGGDPDCADRGMRLLAAAGCAYAVLIDGRLDGWEAAAEPPTAPAAVATGAGGEPTAAAAAAAEGTAEAPRQVPPPPAAAEPERRRWSGPICRPPGPL